MKRVVLLRSNPVRPDPPVEKMANTLLEMGLQVTVLAWDRTQKEDSHEDMAFPCGSARAVRFGIPAVYGARWGSAFALLRFQWRMFCWLIRNRKNWDILHAFDLDTGAVAGLICRLFGKKLVYHMLDAYADAHFFSDSLFRRLVYRMEMAVVNSAEATLLCTEERKDQIQHSRPKCLEFIHNTPLDTPEEEENRMELRTAGAEVKIAYVGTQCCGRGIEELMAAVMEDPRFELHIGGYGPLDEQIREAARQCERIRFYGKLPYAKTISLERQCDLMVALYDPQIPNHRYCAPNKLYEALMLGKPLLMCRQTGWDTLFQQENIGILIPYSQEGIAQGLNSLYEAKGTWPEMAENGQRVYRQKYSWEIMRQRIRKIYSALQ